jgi:hypothetical protein
MATKKNPIRVTESRRAYGVAATARRLGCSREHLSKVLHGKRKANEALARKLKRMGVELVKS